MVWVGACRVLTRRRWCKSGTTAGGKDGCLRLHDRPKRAPCPCCIFADRCRCPPLFDETTRPGRGSCRPVGGVGRGRGSHTWRTIACKLTRLHAVTLDGPAGSVVQTSEPTDTQMGFLGACGVTPHPGSPPYTRPDQHEHDPSCWPHPPWAHGRRQPNSRITAGQPADSSPSCARQPRKPGARPRDNRAAIGLCRERYGHGKAHDRFVCGASTGRRPPRTVRGL